MMKLLFPPTAATTAAKALLRRLPGRTASAAALSTVARPAASSLHEAAAYPVVTPHDYDAGQYGYRVVVGNSAARRGSSTMSRRTTLGDHDYDEFGMFHDSIGPLPPDNLDILSSPEVREILESQRDRDTDLRRGDSMLAKDLQQDAADDGYDSDYEAMQAEEWERCSSSAAASTAEVSEDTADAAIGDDGEACGDSERG